MQCLSHRIKESTEISAKVPGKADLLAPEVCPAQTTFLIQPPRLLYIVTECAQDVKGQAARHDIIFVEVPGSSNLTAGPVARLGCAKRHQSVSSLARDLRVNGRSCTSK
eukprot:4484766-Pleurochrysis_carterae.AAC.4